VITANVADLNGAYDQYVDLVDRSFFRSGLGPLRHRLKTQLVNEADRVIADFRRDLPTVGKQQYSDAQVWLAHALTLDPSDRVVEASLRYCEAQIHRLNGEERLQRRARQAANDSLRQAVQLFEEAATLNGRWPDPYLGLVRVYAVDLDDLDRALEALNQAEKRGYKAGNREAAQFGDGYRSRGDRFRKNAASMIGLPQQKEYLARAADSYRRALEFYSGAPAFGDVADNVRLTQQRLTSVQDILDALEEPSEPSFPGDSGVPFPWR
jgi:tetratricopeptide (TPR) repeat protein